MNKRNAYTINTELRVYQKEWFESNVTKFLNNGYCVEKMKEYVKRHYCGKEEISFSEPFFTGVSESYDSTKPTIMIVGQETNGWGQIETFMEAKNRKDIDDVIKKSQEFTCLFSDIQINNEKETIWKDYFGNDYLICKNKNSFWNFIRGLNLNLGKINFVYNNLNKIHYNVKTLCKDGKCEYKNNCEKLYKQDEINLNKELKNDKTLLENEVEIIRPDIIIFLTGPSYRSSMKSALKNIEETILDEVPNKENIVRSFEFNKECQCFWTYHPCYYKLKESIKKELILKLSNLNIQKS